MKWVICFDISSDRKRYRAVKTLEACSYRVQESVFEGFFTAESVVELKGKLEALIEPETDSVRFYPLCKDCEAKVQISGQGKKVEEVGFIIV